MKKGLLISLVFIFVPVLAQADTLFSYDNANKDHREAKKYYEQAIIAEAQGDFEAAKKLYMKLESNYGDSLFASWAANKLDAMKIGGKAVNREGRAMFIVSSTLFGMWAGGALTGIAKVDDGVAYIWTIIAGATAGLIPSIVGSSNLQLSVGRSTLVSFGWTWGLYQGLSIAGLLQPGLDGQQTLGLALGGSALGYVTALAATQYYNISNGDAAFSTSAAIWGSAMSIALGSLIMGEEFFDDERVPLLSAMLLGNGALVGSLWLREHIGLSSGRVMLVNLGGVFGGLVGLALLATFEGLEGTRAISGLFTASVLAGLVSSYALTMDYYEPSGLASHGSLLGYDRQDGWRVGLPLPQLIPVTDHRTNALRLTLPLVNGQL